MRVQSRPWRDESTSAPHRSSSPGPMPLVDPELPSLTVPLRRKADYQVPCYRA
jgi:hypothetical protein